MVIWLVTLDPEVRSGGADMISSPKLLCATGESEDVRVAVGEGVARFRTGLNQAGEGRPVPSGTRGESTGMLHTDETLAYKRNAEA